MAINDRDENRERGARLVNNGPSGDIPTSLHELIESIREGYCLPRGDSSAWLDTVLESLGAVHDDIDACQFAINRANTMESRYRAESLKLNAIRAELDQCDDSESSLANSPFPDARMIASGALDGDPAHAVRRVILAARGLHRAALKAANAERAAVEREHAANAKLAALSEELTEAREALAYERRARDAAQARANNAQAVINRLTEERNAIERRFNALYGEREAIKGALATLAPYLKESD